MQRQALADCQTRLRGDAHINEETRLTLLINLLEGLEPDARRPLSGAVGVDGPMGGTCLPSYPSPLCAPGNE